MELKLIKEITAIVCVGNSLRSDDGVGPYIASRIKSSENIKVFDAGGLLENVIFEIAAIKPSRIVIIDAADFGGKPGETRILDENSISGATLSTHSFPLTIINKILKDDTNAEMSFLGIQAKSFCFGEIISDEVKLSAENIINNINKGYVYA